MDPEVKALIYLASSAVNRFVPNAEHIAAVDLDTLFNLAFIHQMTAITAASLESAGIRELRFAQERMKTIRKILIMDSERKSILTAFENAQIWYMPLKGVILKDYYPQPGMREMCDNDILFDASRAKDVKAIMESLGFSTVHYGRRHQDDYQKPPVSNFEMHRMLVLPTNHVLTAYYEDIDDRLLSVKGYERRFSNEDFYIYMIVHEYKHFIWRGTGLRSLLDTYVFLHRFQDTLDFDYIRGEMQKIGMEAFEEKNRVLAMTIFQPDADLEMLSEEQKKQLEKYVVSGAYGNKVLQIQKDVEKWGKLGYILRRVFIPMKTVKTAFPYFYEHKLLLPLLPIYRLILGSKNARYEIKMLRKK